MNTQLVFFLPITAKERPLSFTNGVPCLIKERLEFTGCVTSPQAVCIVANGISGIPFLTYDE